MGIAFALVSSCALTAAAYFASPFIQLAEIQTAAIRRDSSTLSLFLDPAQIQQRLPEGQTICKSATKPSRPAPARRCTLNLDLLYRAVHGANLDVTTPVAAYADWAAFRYSGLDHLLAIRRSRSVEAKDIGFDMERIDAFRWHLVAIVPLRSGGKCPAPKLGRADWRLLAHWPPVGCTTFALPPVRWAFPQRTVIIRPQSWLGWELVSTRIALAGDLALRLVACTPTSLLGEATCNSEAAKPTARDAEFE